MKILIAAMIVPLSLFAQPTVSGVASDSVSHSDARVSWTASGCFQNAQRIRYGFTISYEGGAGGGIQSFAGPGFVNSGVKTIFGLSGLLPNTLYHYSAESSCDGGTSWNTPVDATLTTLPLPSPHPALPVGPPAYTPTFPNTSGYNTVSISTSCTGTGLANELQVAISNAVRNQAANGTVITIPAGTTCSGTFFFPPDTNPAIKTFTVTGSTLNVTAHGYSNSQAVMVTAQEGGGFPILTGNSYATLPGPLIVGQIYYITNATANTFQLSFTPGGSPITLLDTGTSGFNFYVTQWPRYSRNAIVIQTSTPDSAFTPAGVRTSPSWKSRMATISVTGLGSTTPTSPNVAITTNWFTHDVWFRGIEITHPDLSALANSSNDPAPIAGFIATTPDSSYITFDRCYIHGLGPPNRIKSWMAPWAGHFATIQNSYMENLVYPRSISLPPLRSANPGLTPVVSGGGLTVGSGSLKLIKGTTCTTSGLTWTNTGGSVSLNPGGFLEVDLDCTPRLILPAGMTASCTGNFNDGSTNHACTVTNTASSSCNLTQEGCFTDDGTGAGAIKTFTIATFPITGGAWGAVSDFRPQNSRYSSEGTQLAYAGMGLGPYYLINNYSSGAGNIWHMDDQTAGGVGVNTAEINPSGYLWKQNTFDMPLSTIPGSQWSDNFEYSQRENTEWKRGSNILMTGNIFQAGQADISPYGCSALWFSTSSAITDVEISYNTIRNSPCAFVFEATPHPAQEGPPRNRVYIHDNISENMNAYTYLSQVFSPNHTGVWLTHGYLMEDMVVIHNTVVDVRGSSPDMFHLILTPQEGTQISNNIFWGNDDNGHHGWSMESMNQNIPSCSAAAKAGMDCANVQGVGHTLYTYQNNVLVPQFTNSQTLTGDAGVSTWQAAYAGFAPPNSVFVQTGPSPAARSQGVGFASFSYGRTLQTGNDYRLTLSSQYCSGCGSPATDHGDIGANNEASAIAQGLVSQPNLTAITATTASVSFVAPDTFGCAVDWSTNSFSTFHRVLNTGGSRLQNVTLGSDGAPLASNTAYSYRVLCAVNQPQGSFMTR
jgi:hypothetical protein